MAFVLADRVQETSTSPGGTGTLTLSGSSVPGFKTFSAGIGTGNTFYYTIYDPVTYEWEVGNGSWSANVLTRTTVLSNSLNTTAFISFTNGNTLYVWVDYPASKALYLDTSGNTYAPNLGATTPSSGSFTTLNSSGDTRLGGLSGNQSLQVNNVASGVNYLQVAGGATGAAPTIIATGSDADVGLFFAMKGWNAIKFNSTTGGQLFQIGQTTGTTANYLQALGNSTGNAPVFSAQGTDANVGLVLTGKRCLKARPQPRRLITA
jgi:hypothetical protein